MNKICLLLFSLIVFSGCSAINRTAYRAGFAGWDGDLSHLTREEQRRYHENKIYLTLDEWSEWLFEESKARREEIWREKELGEILSERKAKGEKPGLSEMQPEAQKGP